MGFPFPKIIPWYEIYTEAVDALWLTGVILRQAQVVRSAVLHTRVVLESEQQRELLRFDAVDLVDDEDSSSDDDSVASIDSIASFTAHLESAAAKVFNVRALRPKQVAALKRIIFDKDSGGRLLVVDRTGGEKSLILSLTAICVASPALSPALSPAQSPATSLATSPATRTATRTETSPATSPATSPTTAPATTPGETTINLIFAEIRSNGWGECCQNFIFAVPRLA